MNKLLLLKILPIAVLLAILLIGQVLANPLWPEWPASMWRGGGGGGFAGRCVCMQ